MKVTTLNLAGYKNWIKRESGVISYLEELKSDVVFLQEVKFAPAHSPNVQSKYINSMLTSPYQYHQATVSRFNLQSDGVSSREGLAVLSKYPIVDSEVIVLTKQPDDKHTRIIQKVDILVDNRKVTFTNVHFSNNQYATEQLAETLSIVREADNKSIILGDFNIFDLQAVSDLYSSEYVASTDFTSYISFPSEQVTLDYILMPHDYKFTSLSIGKNLSDHNALSFEFEL